MGGGRKSAERDLGSPGQALEGRCALDRYVRITRFDGLGLPRVVSLRRSRVVWDPPPTIAQPVFNQWTLAARQAINEGMDEGRKLRRNLLTTSTGRDYYI